MLTVVGENPGWVCGWIARKIAEGLGCPRMLKPGDGTNIYVPYYLLERKTERDIALFTHYSNPPYWERAAGLADVCIAMSKHTAKYLPPEKTKVLNIPPDEQFRKSSVVFGVSGRSYARYGDMRKHADWIDKLACIPGTRFTHSGGQLGWDEMPAWYASIDYLVVLSDNEGGPMGVVEAIAAGKPVIAPDVGWAWDYPVIRYTGYEDLERTIRGLVVPEHGWDGFVSALWEVVT